jgi:hypothetical protein
MIGGAESKVLTILILVRFVLFLLFLGGDGRSWSARMDLPLTRGRRRIEIFYPNLAGCFLGRGRRIRGVWFLVPREVVWFFHFAFSVA